MIGLPSHVRIYLACGVTDMRKGFDTLAAQVQTMLSLNPHDGALYVFRGKRGDLLKVLWWDGQGLCLFCKRLERGKFLWPQARDGSVLLSAAQLSMLLEDRAAERGAGRGWLRHAPEQGELRASVQIRQVMLQLPRGALERLQLPPAGRW